MSRIIVKNLPDKITKEKLLQLFSEKGTVTDVQLKFTKTGTFRKFAFVGYKNQEEAEAAKNSFNHSFINTSQIQVELCAELGDPNKPRAWSKYAPENSCHANRKRQSELMFSNDEVAKLKKIEKEKIKDQQIIEGVKTHEDDEQFTDFVEVIAPELASDMTLVSKNEYLCEKINMQEHKNISLLANKNISDLDYIKLKTGKGVNLKFKFLENAEVSEKNSKNVKLFTIKLSGLPLKVKKSQIKKFLSPSKPFTIRRALKIKGVAYCGFQTEKEMKVSLLKNRSFLGDKQILVTTVKERNKVNESEKLKKCIKEKEAVGDLESIAESGRIFVRNLPYTATEEDLRNFFEKYGPLSEVIFPIDFYTRKPKGFAIITFLIPEHAWKAFHNLDGTIFQGRMLHLLPSHPSKQNDSEACVNLEDTFKAKKLAKNKAKSGACGNWNTYFIGENALAEAMAASYNTSKETVLNDKDGKAAVRLALGETQFVNKMKEFLKDNGVCLEAFENMSLGPRSKTIILVKNLPFGTNLEEIRAKFSKFGELKNIVLPPGGVAAIVEFIEPSEAKIAFRKISYSKFKHLPLYLEWAPERVLSGCEKSIENRFVGAETSLKDTTKTENLQPELKNEQARDESGLSDNCVIFVKNLSFSTEDETLKQHFSICGDVASATIVKKTKLGKRLSSGFGFVKFTRKKFADEALKVLQFSNLDGHKIELKRSCKTVEPEFLCQRKFSTKSNVANTKILVKNVPFQATQKEIIDLFKVFGEIKAVRLPKKMIGTGLHRGFCFVEYNTVNDAKRAINALSQSTHLYGRRLVLEWAAADDDVATLREKTAKQFKTGATEKKKIVAIEEDSEEEQKM